VHIFCDEEIFKNMKPNQAKFCHLIAFILHSHARLRFSILIKQSVSSAADYLLDPDVNQLRLTPGENAAAFTT